MFFEAIEKKFEITLVPQRQNLRELSAASLTQLCECAGVTIISAHHHHTCDSYVLSESSLFVWEHKMMMITCGSTRLCDALLWVIDLVGRANVASVLYARKHQIKPQLQPSQFSEDAERLQQVVDGQSQVMGHPSSPLALFRYVNPSITKINETVLGISMYHIAPSIAAALRENAGVGRDIIQALANKHCLTEFKYDDHAFTPYGYSLNGVSQQHYVALHISPQEPMSYVSFETNLDDSEELSHVIEALIIFFQPQYWDYFGLNSEMHSHNFPAYLCVGSCSLPLEQGYTVHFSQFGILKHGSISPEYL
ncbi:hypothetical protein [Shewanella sp. NIFS-20-20]|uniref:hypothetical protein n=1 Tax=Shewanella sp. NIFS-20-20 TaxID=2853806 RepID=UPI001C445C77|nr:hypothetical protein [Shewanella sp. NIFS-20-20]MBV7314377.1 hypothetical protein [Shewanella sp. NIFS-20-20]